MIIKSIRILLVSCPNCGNRQKIEVDGHPVGKYTKCVFCGKNYCIHKNPSYSQIIKDLGIKERYSF